MNAGSEAEPIVDLAQLIEDARSGSAAAFAALFDRYAPNVYALACRITNDPMLAEDITQDVFIEIWRTIRHYRPERGPFAAWLFVKTRSRCLDHLRRRQRRLRREQPAPLLFGASLPAGVTAAAAPPAGDPTAEQALAALQRQQLWQALAELPPAQRLAIVRHYVKGESHREIAAALRCPLGTVKSWLRYGLHKLRDKLADAAPLPAGGGGSHD